MKDAVTQERIVIHGGGSGNAYMMLPESQLRLVTDLLAANHIPHWVDDDVISIDGEPEVAFVTLGRMADVSEVQRLIDAL